MEMDFYVIFSTIFAATSLVLLVPGPTNTLLMSSGYLVGAMRTAPLLLAEAAGYSVAITAWGFVLLSVAQRLPGVLIAVKLLCTVYLVCLALKLWSTPVVSAPQTRRPIGVGALFLATLLNPKALLFASAIFPREVFLTAHLYTYALCAFLLILAPIGFGWAMFGSMVTTVNSRRLNMLMPKLFSLTLGAFATYLLYSTLR
nr:LysE family translocator [Pseudomonas sp. Marseille-Q3773]